MLIRTSKLLAGVSMRFPIRWVASVALPALLAIHPAAAADVEAGKTGFKKCALCHTTEAGKNQVGPRLFGVVGHKSASPDGTITPRR